MGILNHCHGITHICEVCLNTTVIVKVVTGASLWIKFFKP